MAAEAAAAPIPDIPAAEPAAIAPMLPMHTTEAHADATPLSRVVLLDERIEIPS